MSKPLSNMVSARLIREGGADVLTWPKAFPMENDSTVFVVKRGATVWPIRNRVGPTTVGMGHTVHDEWYTTGGVVHMCPGTTELTFFVPIEDKDYIGFLVLGADFVREKSAEEFKPPASAQGRRSVISEFTFKSSSKPGKTWTVKLYDDGSLSCDCPSWIYQGRNCKHVKDVRPKVPAVTTSGGARRP